MTAPSSPSRGQPSLISKRLRFLVEKRSHVQIGVVAEDLIAAAEALERHLLAAIQDASLSETAPKPDLVAACRGLISYWTRNLGNFQWEKADDHVKRINLALPEGK